MTPTPRTVVELKFHARSFRWTMRLGAGLALVMCCLYVADGQWLGGLLCAALFASCADQARDVSKTLERLK